MRVGVDVGGTFTDVVLVDDERGIGASLKVLTSAREPQRAIMEALRALVPRPTSLAWLGHATTIATNALLGRSGSDLPRVVLVTTEGFRDVVEIARQNRSSIYDLSVERPKALVAPDDRLTVRERMDYRGTVVEPLDEASLEAACAAICERKPAAVAVCLLHSYANDAHERRVAQRVRERCRIPVLCSAAVNPEYREYERFSTTLVSAALAPIVGAYVESLERELRAWGTSVPLYVMRSDGGMSAARVAAASPGSLIESGPAAGVIAAAESARRHGLSRALSFDMGGTTAKAASIVDGVPEIVTEFEAAGATHSGRAVKGSGYPVRYPFVDLAEVSAGGGTIAWLDDAGALHVGPASAGADPGPACYGRSQRATVTDANVVLGRLHQTHLLGGTFPIDARRSREAIAHLAAPLGLGVEETAEGVVRIIDAQMAKVLRIVTVERGLDPREFALVAFGGSGPLHACELARELGITRIVVPPEPGLFSAHGLLAGDLAATNQQAVMRATAETTRADLDTIFDGLEARGRDALREQGVPFGSVRFRRTYDARYRGQSHELQIEDAASLDGIERVFHEAHRRRYGYAVEAEAVELVNARSVATSPPRASPVHSTGKKTKAHTTRRRIWIEGTYVECEVHDRAALDARRTIAGPAIVEQYDCTTYVESGWTASVSADASLLLERS